MKFYISLLVGLLFFSIPTTHAQNTYGKSINADFSVSPTGALTYQVPFEVPSYVLGHFPNLGLAFNSQAGDGIAGWGWSISGLSSITRTSATKYHDGFVDPVDFDANDRFVLDGQRLMLKNGEYGKPGSTYETESYSNLKIEAVGTYRYTYVWLGRKRTKSVGPEYFVVYHPNGSRYWYGRNGASTSSRSLLEWSLTKIEDTQGNIVEFNYSLVDKTLRLDSVVDPVANVSVEFTYTTKSQVNSIAIGGEFFRNNRLLNKITVKVGGSVPYMTYDIVHTTTSSLRKRIRVVRSKNRLNQTLPALKFNYLDGGSNRITESKKQILNHNAGGSPYTGLISGDFDGDDQLDFLSYNYDREKSDFKGINYRKGSSDGTFVAYGLDQDKVGEFESLFVGNYVTQNNEISDHQGLILLRKGEQNKVIFEVNNITASGLTKHNEVEWEVPVISQDGNTAWNRPSRRPGGRRPLPVYFLNSKEKHIIGPTNIDYSAKRKVTLIKGFKVTASTNTDKKFTAKINFEKQKIRYSSGDFNGDGITDILAVINEPKGTDTNSYVYYIDLNPNSPTYGARQVGALQDWFGLWNQILVGDYDGDGKSDFFHVYSDYVKVYTINNNSLNYKAIISSSNFNEINQISLGDFNGDGKVDVFNSTGYDSKIWEFHISTGKSFISRAKDIGVEYDKTSFNGIYSQYKKLNPNDECSNFIKEPCVNIRRSTGLYSYLPIDFDGDGKTDIVTNAVITPDQNDSPYSHSRISVYKNNSISANDINFQFIYVKTKNNEDRPRFGHLVYAKLENKNLQNQLAYVETSGLATKYNFDFKYREETCISSVENNGLETSFTYKGLLGNDWVSNRPLQSTYTPYFSKEYKYPLVCNKRNINGFKVISVVSQRFSGKVRSKYYRYGGLISSIDGSGIFGFNFMANSNWLGVNIASIWNISEYDPLKRGSVKRSWSVADQPQNQSSFPSSNFISKTSYEYDSFLRSNKVFGNISKRVIATNGLTNVVTTTTNTYDAYYNVLSSTQSYPGGSKTISSTYVNNPSGTGANYYIGRPKTKNKLTTLGSESFSTSEDYTYVNNLIKQLKTRGNGTSWLTETYTHDTFGNIESKKISGQGIVDRTEFYDYDDATGRFMESAKDIEGLTTTYKYDKFLGHLKEEIDPFGKKQNFEYDAWNRLIEHTDYLNNTITTNFTGLSGGGIKITTVSSLGGGSETYTNRLGWTTQERQQNALGQWVSVSSEYDAVGKTKRESQPYFTSPSQWNRHYYDGYNRPIRQQMYTGQIISTEYDNLTVIVDDETKTMSVTKDAVGNTVSMTDPGGTINYTYYANNTPKETNFEGHKIINKIDGWGRKTELNDPAAGKYTYKYNVLGEVLEETTPKGKTAYELDGYGKPIKKTVKGDNTDLELVYAYDGAHKQISNIAGKDLTNNRNYTYNYIYDNKQRIINVSESTPLAYFSKQIQYDVKGRINIESYTSTENSTQTIPESIRIKNEYHPTSGQLYKISDASNNSKLWELKELSQRGQVQLSSLGNGITKEKSFDEYGLPEYFYDSKDNTPVYLSSFNFDEKRGNLLSRNQQTSSVGTESFKYDSQDRLTEIAINGAIAQTQIYESNGNIQTNPQVGTYNYNPQTKYRVTRIDLNEEGKNHYQTHTPQSITYNAFKKPVSIHEKGHGRVDFEYGPLMNRSVAYYGGEDVDTDKRDYEKYYSAITPVEIVKDKTNNTVKVITYVGGDAYTAPIAHIENKVGSTSQSEFTYLHRDHLGSIMAISDDSGAVIEKTHYGAWGEIAEYWDTKGNTSLGYSSLLGRGYTGHEHFASVGLIHMNGRMYDAKLRRFLSPDNYIQDPFNTQSFNRYGYVWNNPLKFNDPSGEFIIAAIMIGAFVGALSSALAGGDMHDVLRGFLIGGISAAIGGGIANLAAGGAFFSNAAALTLTTSGFTQGFTQGFAGGFAGGFTQGALGTWANGGSFSDGISNGVKGGLIGGIIAGLGSGVSSGLRALRQQRDFWNGETWKVVGYGGKSKADASRFFADKVEELSKEDWFVNKSLDLDGVSQDKFKFRCSWACKKTADKFYGLNPESQRVVNFNWAHLADQKYFDDATKIIEFYQSAGYNAEIYSGSLTNESVLPWIASRIENSSRGRLVNLVLPVEGTKNFQHNVIVTGIRYTESFSKFRIKIFNPSSNTAVTTNKISKFISIFNVWR